MVKGDTFDYFGESGKTADELRKQGYSVLDAAAPEGRVRERRRGEVEAPDVRFADRA